MTDKLKQLQSMVKSDKLIMSEIRKLVGTGGNFDKLKALQNHLQYGKAECVLSTMKENITSFTFADKIIKLEKEIAKIQTDDYNVCIYMNTVFKGMTVKKFDSVVETKVALKKWCQPSLEFVNSDVRTAFQAITKEKIPVILSKNKVIDLTKLPHLLVAGQTGSGKSVFMNAFISTVLFKLNPEDCKLVLIDPKRVEFSLFKGVPHLWRPVATQIDKIEKVLNELIIEMEERYVELEKTGSRNIDSYNAQAKEKKPYIVVVIDELADLMMVSSHSVENQITRLAQLARSVGIHIVMATQRPVVEIMTGLIKANMPSRISFKVASKQDSRVILDQNGAETLKGAGEMIFTQGGQIEKFQGVYVSEEEIKKIVN
jgi:hypothetical protein